jgi:hypothetical protein
LLNDDCRFKKNFRPAIENRQSKMGKPLDTVRNVISTVAPTLAAALGGPLAGLAAGKISAVLTGKTDTPEAALADSIQQSSRDPALLLKLKQADAEFAEQMKQLGVDLDAIAERDRERARAMQTARPSWIPGFLAVSLTVGFFGLVALLALHAVPPPNVNVLVQDAGILGTAWIAMVAYYFGSSMGADRKTEIMANQVAGRRNITGTKPEPE